MSRGLPPEFVENRIHTLTHVPVDWNVDIREKYYQLDLKMSQMKSLYLALNGVKKGEYIFNGMEQHCINS